MDHETFIRYVNSLGFPVAASFILGIVLWKVASTLAAAHATYLKDSIDETKKQTQHMRDMKILLPTVCQANCPDRMDCTNYIPKRKP